MVSQIRDLTDMERAVAGMAEQPNGGLLFPLDLTVRPLIDQTIATVARYRLPAVYSERQFVVKGGLVYYGADRIEIYRGAASYVDRLLHGEKPGDLPYQLPTKFQLMINLKTAKALGLELPVHLLAIADEVIE